jgi:hypothetical protein
MRDDGKLAYPLTAALLALFAAAPLARPGFPQTAAGFRPVWTLEAFVHCGGWPAVAEHAGPAARDGFLPLGFAALARWAGASAGDAVKWSLALATLLGGLFLYGWLAGRWGRPAALLAAVVYTFLPYRLAVTYVAGGAGELWALALYPLAGWALHRFARRPRLSSGTAALAAWGLLALSHMGLAVWFALFAAGALLWRYRRPLALLPLLPAVPLGGWGLLAGGTERFFEHFVYVYQLFSAAWSTVPSSAGWKDEMSFQLGIAPLALAGLSLLVGAGDANRRRTKRVLLAGVILCCLLTLPISAPFWRISRLNALLAYPWQLLGLAGLALALLAGSAVREVPALGRIPWLAGLVLVALLAVYPYLKPAWTEVQPPDRPLAVWGDQAVALLDYSFRGELAPGGDISLSVTWQALDWLDKDYTVFVQALDAGNTIWGQQDIQPRGGERPTSTWVPGEIITDTYGFHMKEDGPPAGYRVIMGFYDARTGERLPVGKGDHVELAFPRPAYPLPWPCGEVGP